MGASLDAVMELEDWGNLNEILTITQTAAGIFIKKTGEGDYEFAKTLTENPRDDGMRLLSIEDFIEAIKTVTEFFYTAIRSYKKYREHNEREEWTKYEELRFALQIVYRIYKSVSQCEGKAEGYLSYKKFIGFFVKVCEWLEPSRISLSEETSGLLFRPTYEEN